MTNKKKIIFSIHGLSIGGAEKFLISLVNNLDHSIFDCTIISYSINNPMYIELSKEVKFLIFSRKFKFDIIPIFETRNYIKKSKPDLIFCIGFFSFFLMHISSLFNLQTINRIISYHTTIHRNLKDHLMMKFYSKFIKKTDKIVSVCNNQFEYTASRYNINRLLFTTIYNGVDTNYWRLPNNIEKRSFIRDQYKIPSDAKVFIKVACFRTEKNHKAAVDAFYILNKSGLQNCYLIFVGDGILKKIIQNYVHKLNLSNKVLFAGHQSDVRPYYWASNFFTLTSKKTETFSISALEALSCGLPCVLTDIGGANEIIDEGSNGYLSNINHENIAEQWNKILYDSFDKEAISLNIKNNFSLDLMVKKYKILLNNV
jgi:glycosyltransferase involved in cell wall biosynthesis